MNIEWNRVTWYSKILAVIVFVGTFVLGMYLGMAYQSTKDQVAFQNQDAQITKLLQAPAPTASPSTFPMPIAQPMGFTGPADGQSLCQGANVMLSWRAPASAKTVRISINSSSVSGWIGDFPASYNETGATDNTGTVPWQAGAVLDTRSNVLYSVPDGRTYTLVVSAFDSNNMQVGSAKSGLFAIQTCRG
jgi:hypothetical protein